ncbi:MAG: thiopurine S-methyltransferase [Myxococcota bacterium]
MEPAFWLKSWEEGKRGFHRSSVNPHLVAHADRLFEKGGTVLVPLCGATLDLGWLRDQGYWAVGVELSRIAAEEVAEREGLSDTGVDGPFHRYDGDGITVLVGDFFALTPERIGPITGIWDRAALIALHPTQRDRYVALQRVLMASRAKLLLNTLSYDATLGDGPPWSVDEVEVSRLWPEAELLSTEPVELQGRSIVGACQDWLWST